MDVLVKQLKNNRVGLWCRRAAWIIALIGLVEIVLDTYTTTGQLGLSETHLLTPVLFATLLRFALATVPGTMFSFFVLYAAAVAVDHLLGIPEIEEKPPKSREDDDEELDTEDEEDD